ncbi:MAG: hypothetical protein ACJ786_19905 [Catenulispora sp.]
MPSTRPEDAEALASSSGVPRAAMRASVHLRRYMPLYVFGTIWAVMIGLLPTVHHDGGSNRGTNVEQSAAGNTSGGAAAEQGPAATGDPAAAAPGSAPGSVANAGQRSVAGAAPKAAAPGAPGAVKAGSGGPVAAPQVGQGVARSGVQCGPGVRQIAGSAYAAPCVGAFSGENGGVTYNGVTKDTITIAIRSTSDANGPNAQAVDQVQSKAGQLTATEQVAAIKEMLPYFNKNWELYGRQVKLVEWTGQGNGTDEAQSKGTETACSDANSLASSVHAFGVIRHGTFGYESQPFSECAATYKLYLPLGAPYFPEQYYQRWNPYVWGGTMECERIAHDSAEYVIKRLAGKKAKYAGDLALQQADRKFGTYVPDNKGYGRCVDLNQQDLQAAHVDAKERYNYALDVSQFPSEAQRGIIQFKSANVSTIVMACDPISITFLTSSASQQQYHPEWLSIGVALEDTDGYGRLYNADAVNGRLFGMSQLGSDAKLNDKNGEAARAYKATTGKDMPSGYAILYYNLMLMFNQLQAAGPVLTPQNIANTTHALPVGGGASGALGTWDYSNDHTAINDSREIYWDANATGYDGKQGTYVETYGGRRFQSGQWPQEDPPIYPGT